jgi:hypothetical protein
VVLAREAETLKPLLEIPETVTQGLLNVNPMTPDAASWRPLRRREGIRAWTDEYSNLLAVLKWEQALMPEPAVPIDFTPPPANPAP